MNRYRYELIKAHLVEFDEIVFRQKMTEVLDKYDIIIGDFSGGQLRLKGFYHNERRGVPLELKSSTIPEYLSEYCAYGCPYYILEKVVPAVKKKEAGN